MNIISASRRTDIPAFHADWFMQRIRDGFFCRVNPFNSRQKTIISLAPPDVAAIVFWTKDPRPLLTYLPELDRYGYNYYFQFTLNPYPDIFEPNTPPLRERLITFRELANRVGPQRVIWRYDPVILSSRTPVDYHLQQAGAIAAALRGSTRRLVFSLLDFYGTIQGRLKRVPAGSGVVFRDLAAPEMRVELEQLAAGWQGVAENNGLQLCTCAEQVDLSAYGVEQGSCIDAGLIKELFGSSGPFVRDRGQRPACHCVRAVDMGRYNSCRFGCVYCYATRGESAVSPGRW